MAYEKQNFEKGQILRADHLNHMEDGIESNSLPIVLDTSLKISGAAADSKAVGDIIIQEHNRAVSKETEINNSVVAQNSVIGELQQEIKKTTPTTTVTDSAPWSSKHIVDMLCPPLEETGNPVVCYPVAGYPMGVKATWEPVQEGNGTPYPAGGGKNLFNPAWMPEKVMDHGMTWTTTHDGTVTANGTASGTTYYNSSYFPLPAGTYTISAMSHFRISILDRDAGDLAIVVQSIGKPCTFTVENDISKASLFFATSGTLDNASAKPQIEKGTTATAYAPYENIRPIKGRDSVTVEWCGENLLNIKPFNKLTKNGITYEYVPDGGVHISGTATATVDSPVFAVWHLQPGKYYGLDTGTGISTSIVVHRNGANLWLNSKGIFEILAGDVIKYWYMMATNGTTLDTTVYPYIVPGTSVPTTYTPYIGQTATLTLPHTIYGGEVDAVTGEGQETWKLLTLDGTEHWIMGSAVEENRSYFVPAAVDVTNTPIATVSTEACTHYKIQVYNDGTESALLSSEPYAYINTSRFNSVEGLKSYLAAQYAAGTPVQIAYKLAEPVPFTATGAQPIPALSGVNTVLTDADSATVIGRADPIKRIIDLEDAVASMTTT